MIGVFFGFFFIFFIFLSLLDILNLLGLLEISLIMGCWCFWTEKGSGLVVGVGFGFVFGFIEDGLMGLYSCWCLGLCLIDKNDLLLGLCICLCSCQKSVCVCVFVFGWQERVIKCQKIWHVFLCLNMALCSLEFLLKMNTNLNSCIFWILILFFVFYFVKIEKINLFF